MNDYDDDPKLKRRILTLSRLLVNLRWLEPEERRMVVESALSMLDGVPQSAAEDPKPGVVININGTIPTN